jgi:acyl-CoA synthetase (AMP-forming)/AMP-acid ligase II
MPRWVKDASRQTCCVSRNVFALLGFKLWFKAFRQHDMICWMSVTLVLSDVMPGEEAEICVKGACVTKGYETWLGHPLVFQAALLQIARVTVQWTKRIMEASEKLGQEMRAHMDQDPNIEAFTSDGWLRTGDKGCLGCKSACVA